MLNVDKIVSKLRNDGFRMGMDREGAINILNNCVAPVACVKFFVANMAAVFEELKRREDIETATIVISVKGEEVKRFESQTSDFPALRWIQSHFSQSLGWELAYGNLSVVQINDFTGESFSWGTEMSRGGVPLAVTSK